MDWTIIGIFIGFILSGIIIGVPVGYVFGCKTTRSKLEEDYLLISMSDEVVPRLKNIAKDEFNETEVIQ